MTNKTVSFHSLQTYRQNENIYFDYYLFGYFNMSFSVNKAVLSRQLSYRQTFLTITKEKEKKKEKMQKHYIL